MGMKYNSPCLGCPDRRADPNCHTDECKAWAEFQAAHKAECHEVYEGRMRYAGEARQMIDSLRRNKHYMNRRDKRK